MRNEEDIRTLLLWLREPKVGTKVNCKFEGHAAPFQFLCDVLLGLVKDYVVWANRSGSKSYLAGLITWVRSSFLERMETTILGGSFEQSEKSYKAMAGFWDMTGLSDLYLEEEPTMKRTTWKNRSVASVLTASEKSVRGPHPQALIMDEIDEMKEEIYDAALSQPLSKYGIPASTGKLSTNHKIGGMMDIAVERAERAGMSIYKWCIWESIQSCRDYSCSTCKLTAYCPGKHIKNADGYYPIEDFEQKLYELSDMTLQVEWFCNKVGRDDLVYGAQYDEDIHSAITLPGFDKTKPVYLSIDWGGTEPFSIGVWQKFPILGWVRVSEYYKGNTTNQRVIADCKELPWWKKAREAVADPSRSDLIKEWKDVGVDVYRADNEVLPGIEAVRDSLAPVLGNPKFYVNRLCRDWRREVKAYYEKKGLPVKENDHTQDETRYFVMRHIKPRRVVRVRGIT